MEEEILSRLPVKSVVRFNCVSNFWKTLISQPYFKKKHLNHSKNQLSSQKLLFVQWDPNCQFWSGSVSLVKEDIPIFDCTSNSNPIDGIKFYSSCDGLFLIGIWTERHVEQPSILVIWNPSTRQSIRLAHSKFSLQMGDHDHNEQIARDENMGNYSSSISDGDVDDDNGSTYGLAYDSTSEDYKVLRIDMSGNNDNEILALKSGSWRIIDRKTSGRTDNRLLCGGEFLAFVDGAFHWLGFLSKVCVVSFNISVEMYGEISLPEIVSSQLTLFKFDNAEVQVDVHVGVSVLRGMLGVYYKDDKNFSLWVMKTYGVKDSWMKLFTVPSAGFYKIIPTYAFSDNEVLLCFEQENWVTPEHVRIEYVYRIISSGSSHRMFPQDYYDIGTITIDQRGFAYTETLTDIKSKNRIPGRSYRFYKGPTVFNFGDGLSYSQYKHNLVQAPKLVSIPLEEGHACRSTRCKSIDAVNEQGFSNLGFDIHLRVQNIGKMSGSHTVLLFTSPPSVHNAPQKHLLDFQKIHLTPQSEGVVKFNLDVCKHLSVVDEVGNRKVALGLHVLHIGDLKHSLTVRI